MKKLLLALMIGMMGCGNDPPAHSGKVKHGYDLTNKDVIAGSILVDLRDDVSETDIKDLEKIAGTHLHAGNDTARQYKLEDGRVDPANEEAILDRLNADPRVEHAEPMVRVHALFTPNDPMLEEQWGMGRIGTESAWNMTCGRSTVVAVIDTGIATGLSDLAQTKFIPGYNFVDHNEDTTDRQSHGSHVCGTIAQSTNNGIGGSGIAYCSTIMPVKVLSDNGSGTMEGVAEGIRWAADQGVDVINMSLGSSHPSDVVEDAVHYAVDHGVVVVAANGNDSGPIGYPAAYDGVLAIAALDKNDRIADFSSRGPETAVIAPGVDILQNTVDRNGRGDVFVKYSGTSMASPGVAGVSALVVSMGVNKPEAVRAVLQSSAEDLGMDSDEQGAGMVRADKAVRSIIFNHIFLRLLALGAVLLFLRKKVAMTAVKNKLSMIGIGITAIGAFPLYFLGIMPRLGIMGELMARPILEWNNVFGFMTKYLPLGYALPTVLASLLLLNSKVKSLAGGLALGTVAFCTQMAYSNEVNFFLGGTMFRVVMIASAFISLYFVKTIFEKKA